MRIVNIFDIVSICIDKIMTKCSQTITRRKKKFKLPCFTKINQCIWKVF